MTSNFTACETSEEDSDSAGEDYYSGSTATVEGAGQIELKIIMFSPIAVLGEPF